MTYEAFYKKLGVRRVSGLLHPPIIKIDTLQLPKASAIFWIGLSDLPLFPVSTFGLLKNSETIKMYNKESYTTPIGNMKFRNKATYYITKNKSKDKGIKYLSDPEFNSLNDTNLLVINYGLLTAQYNYSTGKLNDLYKMTNLLSTMLIDIGNERFITGRHRFINVNINDSIPNDTEFKKYENKTDRKMLDKFSDLGSFVLLELWKWLTPKLKTTSVFHKLNLNALSLVTLVFIYNGKTTLLNLEILYGSVTEYDLDIKSTKQSFTVVRKLLVNMVKTLTTKNVTPDNKLEGIQNIDYTDDDLTAKVNKELSIKVNTEKEFVFETPKEIKKKDILEEPFSVTDRVETLLTNNLKMGKINKKEFSDTVGSLQEQEEAFGKNFSNLRPTKEEMELGTEEVKLADSKVIIDKTMLPDTIGTIDEKYYTSVHKKNVQSAIYSLQNHGIIIKDVQIEGKDSILENSEVMVIKLKPLGGKQSTIRVKVPIPNKDGTFKYSGNTYRMRRQKGDKPIRKVSPQEVALTSYVRKLFINKAIYSKSDEGRGILRQLEDRPDITMLTLGKNQPLNVRLPRGYTMLGKHIRSFNIGDVQLLFDYKNRQLLSPKSDLKKIEKDGYILFGVNGKVLFLIGDNNKVVKLVDNKYNDIGSIYNFLNLNRDKLPTEYSTIKIFRQNLPLGLLLAYYLGFNKLIDSLDIEFEVWDSNKRVPVGPDQFVIKFSDRKYIFSKDNRESTLLLSGIASVSKYIKDISYNILDTQDGFSYLFGLLGLQSRHLAELRTLDSLFIDPMTRELLIQMKEPTNLRGLLFRANELLLDDYSKDANNVDEMIFKSGERIAGMIYGTLYSSIKEFEINNQMVDAKINVNPFEVWGEINSDSTTVLVDDLNPIAYMKQIEDTTYTGKGGRGVETMTQETRVYHESELGIISEATKDSREVGISAYLSGSPKFKNIYGVKEDNIELDGFGSLLSPSALLYSGSTKDDPKRTNFVSVQNGHTISMKGHDVLPIRTGYENIMAQRSPDKFVTTAKGDGKITKVTKTKVVYEIQGKEFKTNLGSWTTKEEGGTCFKHNKITFFKEKDKFSKGDSIAYDETFFAIDIFNPKQVILRLGTTVNTMFVEVGETHEDSIAISKKFSHRTPVEMVKVKSNLTEANINVVECVSIGQKITPNDYLITMSDSDMSQHKGKFDAETIAILERLSQQTKKAGYTGKVSDIRVMYNCEIDTISESLREIVLESDKRLKQSTGYTGRVDSSYSINGNPLLPNWIEIKFYIDVVETMGIGDKAVLGNQLKATVGDVLNYTLISEDGTEIDTKFSTTSTEARIVESAVEMGTTASLLDIITRKMCELHKG